MGIAADAFSVAWHEFLRSTQLSTPISLDFRDFSHIKEFYNSADYVPPYVVFDVAGNNFRVVVVVQYSSRRVYIREVMTHREYDDWCKRYRKGKV